MEFTAWGSASDTKKNSLLFSAQRIIPCPPPPTPSSASRVERPGGRGGPAGKGWEALGFTITHERCKRPCQGAWTCGSRHTRGDHRRKNRLHAPVRRKVLTFGCEPHSRKELGKFPELSRRLRREPRACWGPPGQWQRFKLIRQFRCTAGL